MTTAQVIVRGSPWDLPAGKVSFALGTRVSREVINAQSDQNSQDNGWVDAPTIIPIDRQRKWFSFFGELEVPIVGQTRRFPVSTA